MVGSNGTMIAIRLVRSKLRKREDHQHHQHHTANSVHPEQVQQQPTQQPTQVITSQTAAPNPAATGVGGGIVNPAMSSSTMTVDSCCAGAQSTIVAALGNGCSVERSPDTASTMVYTTGTGAAEQFIWQFPPPYPPPNTPPPQYTLYNDQFWYSLSNCHHSMGAAGTRFLIAKTHWNIPLCSLAQKDLYTSSKSAYFANQNKRNCSLQRRFNDTYG